MISKRKPFIYLHPNMCNGKPTINGTRLYVQVVAEAWWYGGMTEEEIYSAWPSCKGRGELLLACWWMARYEPGRVWKKRWGKWLDEVEGELWKSNYTVALPPQKSMGKVKEAE